MSRAVIGLLGCVASLMGCSLGAKPALAERSAATDIAARAQADLQAQSLSEETPRGAAEVSVLPGALRAATFNAGLAPGILPRADERAAHVAAAMREVEAEIVCLQEVWMEDHWALVRDALEPRLPHIIRPEAEPGGDLSCSVAELAPVAKCIASQCSRGGESVAECVWRRCRPAMSTASSGCLTCLGSDPRRPLGEVAGHCVSATKSVFGGSRDTSGSPTRMGPDHFYAYGGSRGLALATSLPIVSHEIVPLPSTFTQRAAVHAELETPAGRAHVLCTHLAAGVGPFPPPRGKSWDDVHRGEVQMLIELADDRARQAHPSGDAPFVLVLGDLNTGPGKPPHISARRLQTYRSLLSAGFSSPYADRGDAGCTLCFDNPLDGHRGTRGILIDHVLVRGFAGKLAAFDFMRSPAATSDAGGAQIAFSDHNGVLIALER